MNPFKFLWGAKKTRVWLLVTSSVMAFILIMSLVLTQILFLRNTLNVVLGGERRISTGESPDEYNYYKSSYDSKDDTLAAANKLNEKIVEEGIVLLKNEDAVLPLSKGNKISVFGKNSEKLVYGGSGSGGGNADEAVKLHTSLEAAGFSVNQTLRNFYNDNSKSGTGRPKSPGMGAIIAGFATGETPVSSYGDVKNSYSEYGDAALVVISRIGGEGYDLPRSMKTNFSGSTAVDGARSAEDHYLQLDQNETDLLGHVCDNFEKVIVVINSATSMELGFLDDPAHYAYRAKIKGAVWVASPGSSGISALGRVLNGEVNPSGRLIDTYSRDFKKDPTWQNLSNNQSDGGNQYTVNGSTKPYYYVDYEEGIYVGYRYYETRGYTEAQAGNASWYNENVVYPLGYGKSYTSFDWEIVDTTPQASSALLKSDIITMKVKVTNTGAVEGKEVVQLYYTSPYTVGGIEKAHVVLGAFAKTGLLAPNAEETVTLTMKVSDMASYDYTDKNGNKFKGYELEGGAYEIKLSKDAHTAIETINYNVAVDGIKYSDDTTTDYAVENRFDNASEELDSVLSRSNWLGTFPTRPTSDDRNVTAAFISSMKYTADDSGKPWESNTMPTQAKNVLKRNQTKVKLYQLMGKDYSDPLWEELLNQLTIAQMSQLIGTGNYNTGFILNIDKPKTIDPDGPSGFTNFMKDPSVYGTCFYASECLVAASFNVDIAYEMGKMIGEEGIWGNYRGDKTPYSGWYAPGVNIHRSPFSGRNFEYYSEDGFISGKMAASVVLGAKENGVYTYVKHFAVNDQETNRDSNGIVTWVNEQSMRELYFKPFELSVKEGKTTAIMSSFNRLGTVWAGGSYDLLTEVLRNEWGFEGMVVTDYNLFAHMPADQMIRAGGDLNLCQNKQPTLTKMTATQATSIRNATKNILYTVVNSNAMNGYGEHSSFEYLMPYWVMWLIIFDVVAAVGFGTWGFFAINGEMKKRKNDGNNSPLEAETIAENSGE